MDISELKEWKEVLGTSATIWTILQMLSPVPTCYYFIRKHTVGDMIVTPYVVAFTSCALWFLYGIIISDATVIKVNAIAAILQLSYTLCYYYYCSVKAEVKKKIYLGLITIFGAIIYIFYESNSDKLVFLFGLLCSSVTVLFFVSPLTNMQYVVRTWNSESLPRLLIIATFIVSIQWLIYGYLANDYFITVTNFFGTVLSMCQLILISIIPRTGHERLTDTIV